jgi:hypothetical protein
MEAATPRGGGLASGVHGHPHPSSTDFGDVGGGGRGRRGGGAEEGGEAWGQDEALGGGSSGGGEVVQEKKKKKKKKDAAAVGDGGLQPLRAAGGPLGLAPLPSIGELQAQMNRHKAEAEVGAPVVGLRALPLPFCEERPTWFDRLMLPADTVNGRYCQRQILSTADTVDGRYC